VNILSTLDSRDDTMKLVIGVPFKLSVASFQDVQQKYM